MIGFPAAVGFLLGWYAYHLLMNRAAMMRACCVAHFKTHPTCACRDCAAERDARC